MDTRAAVSSGEGPDERRPWFYAGLPEAAATGDRLLGPDGHETQSNRGFRNFRAETAGDGEGRAWPRVEVGERGIESGSGHRVNYK